MTPEISSKILTADTPENIPENTAASVEAARGIDALAQIKRWFETAVPDPENINLTTQIGVHLEEAGEMLQVLRDVAANQETADQISFFNDVMGHASKRFKNSHGSFQLDLRFVDRVKLLDALCDQIVTAVGIAYMFGMDIEGGLKEVANSNDSKFDDFGQPIFDANRKIQKGPRYAAPNLAAFA